MKKLLYLLTGALIMLVACSKEEGINQEEPKTEVETIDFTYKSIKYSTKVTTKGGGSGLL